MEVTVIDTLRYADQLKTAGVESRQAEAMSRALNDELSGGVATKDDLGHAVAELKGDLGHAVAELKGEIAKVDAKVIAMDASFMAMDEKIVALRDKFETQGRYVFLVLALIAALGLYNAIAPQVSAKAPSTADTESPAPAAQSREA